ncbi:MAG: nucleotidyltransferase [Deltaproteobacteria bacterium]|nr:nucleotidyltransferase [Deltaproteobacteria bacterium]
MQDLQALLKLLVHSPVDFVLVGGFAAVLHGSNQTTRDIDICIIYSSEQVLLLRELLKPYHPRYRMEDPKRSFLEVPEDVSKKQDFHLTTDLGILDVISDIEGVGGFYDVLKNSEEIEIYGAKCRLISIEDLIKSKKALGRHRDLVTAMELEAICEERRKGRG